MSEWKTVRVRADRLAEVKARAEVEGTNATAWIDQALGAALAEPRDGAPVASGRAVTGSTPESRTPAPRRAPVMSAAERVAAEIIERNRKAARR